MTIHVCGVPGRLPHGHTLQACPAKNMSLYYSFHFWDCFSGSGLNFFQNFFQAPKPPLDSFMYGAGSGILALCNFR